MNDGLIFRSLFDATSSTYTYVVADPITREALLVDSVFEHARRDAIVLRELGLRLVATLDTHVHADHVTGAWVHKRRLGSAIVGSRRGGAARLDRAVEQGDRIAFGDRHLFVLETPGHTEGCLSFVLDDRSRVLTGDCLLIRGTGRTDFQGGDARTLYRSVHERLFTLPEECLVHPAHDYRGLSASSIGEEKRWNPRVGGTASEGDFTTFATNLALPMPRAMERAVPANLQSGRPEREPEDDAPTWAELTPTLAGLWEIAPEELEPILSRVTLLDVREEAELVGPLGVLAGSRHIPLGALAAREAEIPRDRPVVLVCRSGTRSARGAVVLGERGHREVANLSGGMLRWVAEGRPVLAATAEGPTGAPGT